MYRLRILPGIAAAVTGFALMSCPLQQVAAATVFKCTDARGQLFFTDDRRKCEQAAGGGLAMIDDVEVEVANLHSQYGATLSEEYHNYLFREYEALTGYDISIIVEKALLRDQPEMARKAAVKLNSTIKRALTRFPAAVRPQFAGVRYYLFNGTEARTGGRKGGQWYFREGNRIGTQFDNSIVIRSAKDYLAYSSDRALQIAVHELAHGYYYYNRGKIGRPVQETYRNASDSYLYRNVSDKRGRKIAKAYALENHREYFSELSKVYFAGHQHFPFTAEQLRDYDPKGYALVLQAYGISGQD